MSNDQALINQSMSNPALLHLLRSRDAFEARLRQMQGVEYKFGPAPKNLEDGVLVIRKQHRRKIPGEEDKVTILGTYFMVAETIYQAPSLSDILGSKIVSANSLGRYHVGMLIYIARRIDSGLQGFLARIVPSAVQSGFRLQLLLIECETLHCAAGRSQQSNDTRIRRVAASSRISGQWANCKAYKHFLHHQ